MKDKFWLMKLKVIRCVTKIKVHTCYNMNIRKVMKNLDTCFKNFYIAKFSIKASFQHTNLKKETIKNSKVS